MVWIDGGEREVTAHGKLMKRRIVAGVPPALVLSPVLVTVRMWLAPMPANFTSSSGRPPLVSLILVTNSRPTASSTATASSASTASTAAAPSLRGRSTGLALRLILVELLDVLGDTILISWFIASSNTVSQLPTVVAWVLDWPAAQLLDLAELVALGNVPLMTCCKDMLELQHLDQDVRVLIPAGKMSPGSSSQENQVCLLNAL